MGNAPVVSANVFKHRKAVQALNFFALAEGGTINKMKAIKLIWLADRLHIRRYGRSISGDKYFAMKHGPVASDTVNLAQASVWADSTHLEYRNEFLKTIDEHHFKSVTELGDKELSKSDLAILEVVYKSFGHLDQWQLSELSHSFPEWTKFEAELKANPTTRFEIDINDFLSSVEVDGIDFFQQNEDYLALVRDLVLEKKLIHGAPGESPSGES